MGCGSSAKTSVVTEPDMTRDRALQVVKEVQEEIDKAMNDPDGLIDPESIPVALRRIPLNLRKDRDVVLAAVTSDGRNFEFAATELRGDREIVLITATEGKGQDGETALKYANAPLRSDEEIVLEAALTNGHALKFAGKDLMGNRNFLLKLAENAGGYYCLMYADAKFRSDREVVLAALQNDCYALHFVSKSLRTDSMVLATLKEEADKDPDRGFEEHQREWERGQQGD